mmetsp:Transcript_661/g.1351  ORF Transcript_661/g.1351 Transcript_661/m.1351 type:complete len:113 (-) Transcript_661:212-550(-)
MRWGAMALGFRIALIGVLPAAKAASDEVVAAGVAVSVPVVVVTSVLSGSYRILAALGISAITIGLLALLVYAGPRISYIPYAMTMASSTEDKDSGGDPSRPILKSEEAKKSR